MQINLVDSIAIPAPRSGPGAAAASAVAAQTVPAAAPQAAPDKEAVRQAAEAANKAVKSLVNSLEFSVDEQTGKTIVRVVDTATRQLIRQIPSEEMIAISHALDRLQGLLLRSKA